jgi:hypothetical protein
VESVVKRWLLMFGQKSGLQAAVGDAGGFQLREFQGGRQANFLSKYRTRPQVSSDALPTKAARGRIPRAAVRS